MALVAGGAGCRLVVHEELDTLGVGIVVEGLDVKVWIRSSEVENLLLAVGGPVLPADVPALDKHLVEMVLGGEVDVAAHVGIVGAMGAAGLCLGIVGLAEAHVVEVVGIVPSVAAYNHLPPDATVFDRMNPRRVGVFTRLIEVERELAREHVACVVADKHRAPRRGAGCLHEALHARGVGREPRLKHHVLIVEVEVHRGIIDAGSLVDVDVKAIVSLQLQRGLHAGGREGGLRGVAGNGRRHALTDAGETRDLGLILLGVVVAGNPVGRMVARHGKLRVFLLDDEVVEVVLLGELVAQAHAVVVDAEADDDMAVARLLKEVDGHLVVVVADGRGLAPHGLPGLVKGSLLAALLSEAVHQTGLIKALAGMFLLGQLKAEMGGLDYRFLLVAHLIGRHAVAGQREAHHDVAVGRLHCLRTGHQRHEQGSNHQIN